MNEKRIVLVKRYLRRDGSSREVILDTDVITCIKSLINVYSDDEYLITYEDTKIRVKRITQDESYCVLIAEIKEIDLEAI